MSKTSVVWSWVVGEVLATVQVGREDVSLNNQGSARPTNTQLLALVLKLLKMATGMRALLDTVVQALPQVGLDPGTAQGWVLHTCPQG